jgi:hypothetical protein
MLLAAAVDFIDVVNVSVFPAVTLAGLAPAAVTLNDAKAAGLG